MVRGLQNLAHYYGEYSDTSDYSRHGLFSLHKCKDEYFVTAGNIVDNKDVDRLKREINNINNLDLSNTCSSLKYSIEELKCFTNNHELQRVLTIAKNMGTELRYEFRPIDDKHSYFYLNAEVPMKYDSIPNNFADYKKPIEEIKELKDIIDENSTILFFKGAFNQDSLLNLLTIVESQLQIPFLRQKIYNIMVEMLQNISKHANNFTEEVNWNPGIFAITETANDIVLTSGNYIINEKVNTLRDKIELANKLDEKELNKLYNSILQNFDVTRKRGLGLLDLRKKSKSKLNYYFNQIDDKFTFFIMQINVNKPNLLNALIIEETKETPRIHFDPQNGVFEILKRSLPEDAGDFYEPIIKWIKEYSLNPNSITDFVFKLEYYNTTSAVYLTKIISELDELNKKSKVKVHWYYNELDEDMMANGKDFQTLSNLDIDLISY